MAEQQRLALAHRRSQALLRAQIVRDVTEIWNAAFDPANAGQSWPQARELLIALIRDRYPTSVQLAGTYYQRSRLLAGLVEEVFEPFFAPPPPREQLESSLSATGMAAYFTALDGGQQPEEAKRTSSVTVSGAASRLVLSGGRETVHGSIERDPAALGFIRVTDADPCFWCAMQASRGPVFKTEATAVSAGQVRKGRGFHDHDACIVAPVYDGSTGEWLADSADLSDQWARVTSGKRGAAAVHAWRSYWKSRHTD